MSNAITITVELGPESQAKLDMLLAALTGLRPNCHSCTETALRAMGENMKACQEVGPAEEPTAPNNAAEPVALEIVHPADEVSSHGEPEPVAEPEVPKYTKADVLAMVQKLAAPNSSKREQAKAIVKSYGAKVSDVPEDKYPEVMDKLTKLAEEG